MSPIIDPYVIDLLRQQYGFLLEPALLEEVLQVGAFKKAPEGTELMDIGDTLQFMPLLLSGAIKVLREDKEGNELVLYYIEKGDTCAMSFSCCLGSHKSQVRTVAESDVELIMIPVKYMTLWMANYPTWQQFIVESYHMRMVELLDTVDTLAFMRMDERLLKYLQDKAMVAGNDTLKTTHHEIARDLNTSRVVVSRLLKRLEYEGKILLKRNEILVVAL